MHEGRLSIAAPVGRKTWFGICAMLALASMSSCGITPRMETTTSQVVALSGEWLLDRRDSDDVRARLMPLIEKKESRWRALEKRMGDESSISGSGADAPPPGGADLSTMQWMRQQRRSEAETLIGFIAPANQLDISMLSRDGLQEISVKTDKGEGTRVLVPGQPSSLFVGVGGFKLNSGWHGGTFIVSLSGSGDNSMQVVQYYTVTDGGDRLEMRMETRLPELGREDFHFVYKRNQSP
jgi:hypothetical protein